MKVTRVVGDPGGKGLLHIADEQCLDVWESLIQPDPGSVDGLKMAGTFLIRCDEKNPPEKSRRVDVLAAVAQFLRDGG